MLHTTPETAVGMGDRKYYYGLISEVEADGIVEQVYMSYYTDSIARWALSYIDTTKVVEPEEVRQKIRTIIENA